MAKKNCKIVLTKFKKVVDQLIKVVKENLNQKQRYILKMNPLILIIRAKEKYSPKREKEIFEKLIIAFIICT